MAINDGNGNMSGSEKPLPRSDEVYVIKVWIDLTKVAISVLLNVPSKETQRLLHIVYKGELCTLRASGLSKSALRGELK